MWFSTSIYIKSYHSGMENPFPLSLLLEFPGFSAFEGRFNVFNRVLNFRNMFEWLWPLQKIFRQWFLISIYKQLVDEVFVISRGIINVEVSAISRSRRLRLIALTEILIIPDITKTESNNRFVIIVFKENNDNRFDEANREAILTSQSVNFPLLPRKSCIARATYRLFTNL